MALAKTAVSLQALKTQSVSLASNAFTNGCSRSLRKRASPALNYVQTRSFWWWHYPVACHFHDRRRRIGADVERPRSAWYPWNYDAEIFAFGQRLHEQFNEDKLRVALTTKEYAVQERDRLAQIGAADIDAATMPDNSRLAISGEELLRTFIPCYLRSQLPFFPEEGIQDITNFMITTPKLAYIGRHIGIVDLLLNPIYPPTDEHVAQAFKAVLGALADSYPTQRRAEQFIIDFVCTQLHGQDVNEIYQVKNAFGVVQNICEQNGFGTPEARLQRSSGASTIFACYWVGIYVNNKYLLGESPGETVLIAEDMAARDALRRFFHTRPHQVNLLFGKRAGSIDFRRFRQPNRSLDAWSSPSSQLSDDGEDGAQFREERSTAAAV